MNAELRQLRDMRNGHCGNNALICNAVAAIAARTLMRAPGRVGACTREEMNNISPACTVAAIAAIAAIRHVQRGCVIACGINSAVRMPQSRARIHSHPSRFEKGGE